MVCWSLTGSSPTSNPKLTHDLAFISSRGEYPVGGPQNLEPFLPTFASQDRAPCQVPPGSRCRGPALRKPASLGLEVCLRLPLGFD